MLSDLRYRLRALLRRNAMEHELVNELEFHRERLVSKLLATGLTPAEAERQARLKMGGAEQVTEACRDARGVSLVETTAQDLRYALRQLRKGPVFALVVTTSLGLGIGANTAIFSLIDAVLLRSLPVRAPHELFIVAPTQADGTTRGVEYAEYRNLAAARSAFEGIAAYATTRFNVGVDGSVPTAQGQLVSGNYFAVLGVFPAAGRLIGNDDDQRPNGHPVAVLGHGYWRRIFAQDRSIVGRTIILSGQPFTIIGVAPREFFGLEVGTSPDIYVPVTMQPAVMPAAENWLAEAISRSHWLTMVGRLRAEHTPVAARASLAGLDVIRPLWRKPQRPGDQPEIIPETLGLEAAATGISVLRSQFSQPLFLLMAAVAIVLLVACANVASLVLARSAARQAEFSLRLALGAGRLRLVRQLLLENLVLAACGGAVGVIVAQWATGLLVTFMSSGRTPIVLDVGTDHRVLAFTAAAVVATGLLCGVAPAVAASRSDISRGFKAAGRGVAASSHWLRRGRILVVCQVALCVLLLFAAGLFARTQHAIDVFDDGFARDRVLVMRIEPRGSDQRGTPGTGGRLDRTYRELLERVRPIAGVSAASLAHYAPTTPVGYAGPLRLPSGEVSVSRMMVYPGYFATMGLTIRSGRDLEARDLDQAAPQVGVVNEAFVRELMNGQNPVGRQFPDDRNGGPREIVGVVADSRYASLRGRTPPLVYQPFLQTQTGRGQMTLHVRLEGDAPGVVARIREEVRRIDPHMPLLAMHTLADQMASALSRERLVATLSGLFGALALLLAAIGLYGLMAFAVVQRRSELGVRMALGADRTAVVGMVMRDALRLVVAGLAIGMPAALLAGRLASDQMSNLLFGVTSVDPATLAGAAGVLLVVAAAAAYLPAARAARVDPIEALRAE